MATKNTPPAKLYAIKLHIHPEMTFFFGLEEEKGAVFTGFDAAGGVAVAGLQAQHIIPTAHHFPFGEAGQALGIKGNFQSYAAIGIFQFRAGPGAVKGMEIALLLKAAEGGQDFMAGSQNLFRMPGSGKDGSRR